jgi:protein TonB
MDAVQLEDNPWRRLPWLGTTGALLTLVSLMGFVRLLQYAPDTSSAIRPIDVQLFEVPVPVPVPQPPAPKPRPLARPLPTTPMPPKTATPPPPPSAPEITPPTSRVEAPAPEVESAPPATQVYSPPVAPPGPSGPLDAAPQPSVAAVPRAPVGPPGGGRMGARAIYQPMPEIPEQFRRQSLDVVAIARFRVAANGTAQVELIQNTSNPELDQVLLEALKRWRFFPGMQDGKPVASTVDVRVPISVK